MIICPIHELWESNDCHNPAGAGGGQFCSTGAPDLRPLALRKAPGVGRVHEPVSAERRLELRNARIAASREKREKQFARAREQRALDKQAEGMGVQWEPMGGPRGNSWSLRTADGDIVKHFSSSDAAQAFAVNPTKVRAQLKKRNAIRAVGGAYHA